MKHLKLSKELTGKTKAFPNNDSSILMFSCFDFLSQELG